MCRVLSRTIAGIHPIRRAAACVSAGKAAMPYHRIDAVSPAGL